MILHLLPRTRRIKNCAVDAANSRKCLLNNLSENRALIFFLSGSAVCCTVKVQKAFRKDAGEAENRPRGVAILLFLREEKSDLSEKKTKKKHQTHRNEFRQWKRTKDRKKWLHPKSELLWHSFMVRGCGTILKNYVQGFGGETRWKHWKAILNLSWHLLDWRKFDFFED